MTQLLITISNILRHYLLFLIGGVIAIAAGLKQWHKTPQGALIIDRSVLRLPIFGDLLRKVAISRFSKDAGDLAPKRCPYPGIARDRRQDHRQPPAGIGR